MGPLWEGHHGSRRCSRDTYPESYIAKYTRYEEHEKFRVGIAFTMNSLPDEIVNPLLGIYSHLAEHIVLQLPSAAPPVPPSLSVSPSLAFSLSLSLSLSLGSLKVLASFAE